MPLMKPFMWAGVAMAAAGLMLLLAQYLFKANTHKATKFMNILVFIAALFFIFAQVAGYLLNMTPAINFGDSSNFEFILVSFWEIGLGFLLVSVLLKFAGTSRRTPIQA